ncbi:MAG: 2-oxoglutarate dehydrogenase E1 component [Bdellovibrionia bacterium]
MNNDGLNQMNLEYIEAQYLQFKANPQAMEPEWQRFFQGVEFSQGKSFGFSEKELGVFKLIQTYRDLGHLEANLNPLAMPSAHPALALKNFGLSEQDLKATFQMGKLIGKENATLQDILTELKKTYCGTLSLQCMDAMPEAQNWLIQEFEKTQAQNRFSAEEKKAALKSVTNAETLEKFIHTRYVGTKRFSVEGGDILLPMMDQLVEKGSQQQVEEVVIGMAHRGRVNMLANFMGKGLEYVFGDFNGPLELAEPIEDHDGDVKYHLGYVKEKKASGGNVKCTMAFNPSHLEAVNTVVLGMARAIQKRKSDTLGKKVIPVLVHGDAAFAGQGIVLETLQMSGLDAYKVGGTVHIVIDNQVGFTTNADKTRSTTYSSDVAKAISIPVLHVNGDDMEAGLKAMELALKYRQTHQKDIVINIICYRRFGHNEGDEPAYTQAALYEKIKKHPTLREIYGRKLTAENVVDTAFVDGLYNARMDELQKVYDETKKNPPKLKNFKFDGYWSGLRRATPEDFEKPTNTQFDLAKLKAIGEKIGTVPASFNLHPKLVRLVETRKAMGTGSEPIDWGTAEMLAFGTLLSEGHSVRLTGQDVVRGTFTHRHAAFYDTQTGKSYSALTDLNKDAEFYVQESFLSEYGVLGYEYGYSITDPQYLNIWEAQFGDFSNGAQIIIDQFISAAESKWQQMSGMVMLLPHGYEGQGPEHSSARLERYLQLCAQHNMTVVNLTTPAQIYHALRRQLKRSFRRPLVVMSPKKLLRFNRATSTLEDLAQGTFQEVIADTIDKSKVTRAVFVSGKFYYDLLEEREKNGKNNVALIRLEQIYPFPAKQVVDILKSYPNLKEVVWAQEEPKNMGAWQHVYFRFLELMLNHNIRANIYYNGRSEKASPATGSVYRHGGEQADIIAKCFKG